MSYVDMVEQACATKPGKFCSRAMIKSYLTANFGIVDNATSRNHLKKALTKFEKKGDSFKASKKDNKEKLAAKKAAAKTKAAAKKAAAAAKKQAKKEKAAAKKAAVAAKKQAKKDKAAAAKVKKPAGKKTVKKAVNKIAAKKK